MFTRKLILTAASAVAALATAGAAQAANQNHWFVFTNSSSENLTVSAPSISGAGPGWSPSMTTGTIASGNNSSGNYITNDFVAISFSQTVTSQADNSYCVFSIYSQLNSFNNLQFYETVTPHASTNASPNRTPVCTITAPRQPYSTHDGNVEMDYNMHY